MWNSLGEEGDEGESIDVSPAMPKRKRTQCAKSGRTLRANLRIPISRVRGGLGKKEWRGWDGKDTASSALDQELRV